MHSKQLTFFWGSDEIGSVKKFLLENGCLILKRNYDGPPDWTSYDIESNPETIFQFCLCKNEDKDKVFFEGMESSGRFYIDILKSFCIEFSLGGYYPYSNKEYHSSRLYYVSKYYENGILLNKDQEFINWANGIITNFKRTFLRRSPKYSNDYFSNFFLEWIEEQKGIRTRDGSKFIIDL